MRIRLKTSREEANTLFLTLVITGILGFLLVAYLTLVRSQNVSNMRSQSWNQTIPVIEAGVEDALTHLNSHGLTNLSCDKWEKLGDIYYVKRWVGDNYYLVTISNWIPNVTNNSPIIESRGFVKMPTIMSAIPGPFFAQYGGNDSTKYLGRGVRVTAKQDFLFAKGLVAKGKIDLNGNNIATDSYDSSMPGIYSYADGEYDPYKRRDHGDIATNSGLTNSVSIGNADIWGHVSTGPKGSVSIGPQGSVGDLNWHNLMRKGIKPGWTNDDMNVDFPDVDPPFTSGDYTPSDGTNGSTYCKYLLDASGNYSLTTLTLSGGDKLYVPSNVIAVLYVTGDIDMSGGGAIEIAEGGTLKLYCGGANASLTGNGVLNNGGNATNFSYFGLPSNTSVSLGGNSGFIGTIYAPQAELTLNGSGTTAIDICGASVTGTVQIKGHFKFHYDEALSKFGPFRRYIVTRWDEMPPAQVSASAIDISPANVIH